MRVLCELNPPEKQPNQSGQVTQSAARIAELERALLDIEADAITLRSRLTWKSESELADKIAKTANRVRHQWSPSASTVVIRRTR